VQKVSDLLKRVNEELKEIDPMPWHQAALLGIAVTVMILMAVLGDYVSW
jgi:hypothetical protein